MNRSQVIFYYDVVCPFAYMASRLVEAMGQRTGAEIIWRPVLLGQNLSRVMRCVYHLNGDLNSAILASRRYI